MNSKLLGSILLIVGTSIGGGMLALPIATAQLGFLKTLFFLILCWSTMTASALLILEVNLWHSTQSNLITMAKTTLGYFGQCVAWVSYLLLLYALLAAYISGGGDFLQHFLVGFHLKFSLSSTNLIFAVLLSLIVYKGIRHVDYVNRGLMFIKLTSLLLLILSIFPFVNLRWLFISSSWPHLPNLVSSVSVIITSFGFAIIVPSLRSYLKNDVNQLRKTIFYGSIIPLICYILWEWVIMGVVPQKGIMSLNTLSHSQHASSDLLQILNKVLQNTWINVLAKIFSAICLLTSFLGVALSLFDFLKDGIGFRKSTTHHLFIYALTFFPPILLVNRYPHVFVKALSYAGVFCTILLIALPTLMVWWGRYIKNIAHGYQVYGGKTLLICLFTFSIILIVLSIAI